ncbi:hypothetical protein KYN89_15245 [Alteriqipengyuania sp. NZ-12B]|uniref:Uncharacterized protein n=1 Tax=Alteriqipengyuania abyssalis TaxID=2860200 RepID=A0ABS7PH54_9SPHN|nr:hypothetical protein [Alteriqipengyuania abyssalis]MBY8338403.1 hypothetical protein [Alteriqipengyuania abyssalis]
MSHQSTVDQLIDSIRELQFMGEDEKYDVVDLDDGRLRAKLARTAKLREPTVADLDRAVAEIEAEDAANLKKQVEFNMKCSERRDDLRVFYVYNTADRKMTVLARNVACARYYARANGHIQQERNGRVMVMPESAELELRRSGDPLGRALRDGYPGVITKVGENVVNENREKVYTPMTIVK